MDLVHLNELSGVDPSFGAPFGQRLPPPILLS